MASSYLKEGEDIFNFGFGNPNFMGKNSQIINKN